MSIVNEDELNLPTLAYSLAGYFSQQCLLSEADKQWFFEILLSLSKVLSEGNVCHILSCKEQERIKKLASNKNQLIPVMINPVFMSKRRMLSVQPLVLSQQRLYWYRHWYYEQSVASLITRMASLSSVPIEYDDQFKQQIEILFPSLDNGDIDWQRKAAEGVVSNGFSLVVGGPGTGKTTTVLKILALLQSIQPEGQLLSIALAAPTGKAAVRLQESLGQGVENLAVNDEIKASIPKTVTTIHKLLGTQLFSPYFKHNQSNPLVYELIVIDEASMIDLPLMAKLLAAMKLGTRLILLGDQNQLASVEVGFILSDLVSALPQHTFELKKTWRFNGPIKDFSNAINKEDADKAWRLLTNNQTVIQLEKRPVDIASIEGYQAYHQTIKSYLSGKINDISIIYDRYLAFKVLCALKHGEGGVESINQAIIVSLKKNGFSMEGRWYVGRPVMITRNDPVLELFNGDIGICLPEKGIASNRLVVYFPVASGWKKVLPSRLVSVETAYALTIHKSQGSEFSTVLVSLPNQVNALVTKELIYTAITRAKKRVWVSTSQEVFKQGVNRAVTRMSGLLKK